MKPRYVVEKSGILNPALIRRWPNAASAERAGARHDAAEIGVKAAEDAGWSSAANRRERIGAVRCAASSMQRSYPMAIEIQATSGSVARFDVNVACSSPTFGMKKGVDCKAAGSTGGVLVVNPEICSGHLNFRDRDSHFIFGDVSYRSDRRASR